MATEWKPDEKIESPLDTEQSTDIRGTEYLINTKDVRVRSGTQSYRVNQEGMFLGSEQLETAPFGVYMDGSFKSSAGTITGTISGGTITGSNISGGTITGGYMSASEISGGTITGVTITGSVIKAVETLTAGEAITAGEAVCIKNSYLDPIYPTHDSYTREDSADSNYGSETILYANYSATGHTYLTFIKFDMGDISIGSEQILKAELHFYITNGGGAPKTFEIFRVTGADWDESTITWNTQPDVVTNAYSPGAYTIFPATYNTDYYIDITQLVRLWKNGTYNNYGLRINAGGATSATIMGSVENAEVTYRPYLRITSTTSSDSKVYLTDADDYNLCRNVIGIATENAVLDADCDVQTTGVADVTCNAGERRYLGSTPGDLVNSVLSATRIYQMGIGTAANQLLIEKRDANMLIESALGGYDDYTFRIADTATQYLICPPDATYALVSWVTDTPGAGVARVNLTGLASETIYGGAEGFTITITTGLNGMLFSIHPTTNQGLIYNVYFYK